MCTSSECWASRNLQGSGVEMIWPRRESSASRAGPVRKDLHLSAVLIIPPLGPSKPPQDSPAACLGQGFAGVHSLFHARRAANSMTAVGQDLHRWTGASSRRQPPGRRWRAGDRWLLRPLDHYRIGWSLPGFDKLDGFVWDRKAHWLASWPRWLRRRSCGPSLFNAAPHSHAAAQPAWLDLRPAFPRAGVTGPDLARRSAGMCRRDSIGSGSRLTTPQSGIGQVSAGAARCLCAPASGLGHCVGCSDSELGSHPNDLRWLVVSVEWVVVIAPEQDWESWGRVFCRWCVSLRHFPVWPRWWLSSPESWWPAMPDTIQKLDAHSAVVKHRAVAKHDKESGGLVSALYGVGEEDDH